MSIPKGWSPVALLENITKIYSDVDTYFVNDIKYFDYADYMYNNISIQNIEVPITVKEMLDKGGK